MTPPERWVPGWLTLGIVGAAGFLLGVVVLVIARGVVHDEVRTVTVTQTRTVEVVPTVPDVVGVTLAEAEETLGAAGYAVDAVGGGFFGPGRGDTVVEQDPAAGTELPGGATVTVRVE
ncbi:MAG: PASTA domain-containing protein [Solirubrobacteraceae bacterium]|nr:PASTA domain-containing protein [Solirubrobacteraceae bacterium]